MVIQDQLNQIKDTIQGWMDELPSNNGKALVASDFVHFWDLVYNGPKTFRAVIMFNGEESRETDFPDADIMGRVDRNFLIVFTRGRSLTIDRGSTLVNQTSSGAPLYDLVQQARDVVRSIIFDAVSTERPINYKRIIPFPTDGTGIIIDALQLEILVGVQIPMISYQPDNLVLQ